MSNIHGDLIKNATEMQSRLLQFTHELSNLSLKSLEEQSSFRMATAPNFNPVGASDGTLVGDAETLDKTSSYIKVVGTDTNDYKKVFVFKITAGSVTGTSGTYNLSSYIDDSYFKTPATLTAIPKTHIYKNVQPSSSTVVSFRLESDSGPNMSVVIPANGVPEDPTATGSHTTDQKSVAKALAVVAMNLRGVNMKSADIHKIFKEGITPTSLAAVESQLKGHHDAVLQLSLESLSRVTQILQKIAQKLSS
jgi:hypothetical protein